MEDKRLILLVSIVVILLMSAIISGVLIGIKVLSNQKKEFIDCGVANAINEEDKAKLVHECVYSSLKTCTPAKGTIIGAIEGSTMENGKIISNDEAIMSQNFVIGGFENEMCLFELDVSAEQSNQKLGIGMNCKIPKSLLIPYTQGEVIISDYCESSEIHGSPDALKELYGGQK